jgi:hypothetical protein
VLYVWTISKAFDAARDNDQDTLKDALDDHYIHVDAVNDADGRQAQVVGEGSCGSTSKSVLEGTY